MAPLKVTAVLVTLSILVLGMAAFLGPNDAGFNNGASASIDPASEFDSVAWCEAMEAKPNKEWLESDFKLFAALCLGD